MADNETIGQEGEAAGAYRAYLLRCWQENVDGEPLWRFTLVQMGDDHCKKGFASLEDLIAFLQEDLDLSQINKEPSR